MGTPRMPVITAADADLALVRKLVRDAPRRQIGLGEEDLPALVAASVPYHEVQNPSCW